MNRNARRAQIAQGRCHLRRGNKAYTDGFVEISREEWPDAGGILPRAVYRSRRFMVQVIDADSGITRLTVCRTAVENSGHWRSDVTWEDLQSIKSALGFGDRDAVEVFPRDADVVNVANMRHLWVLPGLLSFAWRSGR